jgi:rare lipoprotein A
MLLRVLLILAVAILPAAARSHAAPHRSGEQPYFIQTGRASFYGERHDGLRTANGETFDRTAFTAAHPWLPFGTIARVTNLRNHRMVKVRITDRGPHVQSRVIDVSAAAAREIGMQRRGVARVKVLAFHSDQAGD